MCNVRAAMLSLGIIVLAPATARGEALFAGQYDFALWTAQRVGTGNSFGSIVTGVDTLELTSSNDQTDGKPEDVLYFVIAALGSGWVTFDWYFETHDTDGPTWDPAGYVVNGTLHQLSQNSPVGIMAGDPPLQNIQSGSGSFWVNAGDIFGFYSASTDSRYGSSVFQIGNGFAPDDVLPGGAPEIDLHSSASAVVLLTGLLLMLRSRLSVA